jgi:hypothetical protein
MKMQTAATRFVSQTVKVCGAVSGCESTLMSMMIVFLHQQTHGRRLNAKCLPMFVFLREELGTKASTSRRPEERQAANNARCSVTYLHVACIPGIDEASGRDCGYEPVAVR